MIKDFQFQNWIIDEKKSTNKGGRKTILHGTDGEVKYI